MKHILSFLLVLCFIFTLSGCERKNPKNDIFGLVENNYDEIAAACKNKDIDALLTIDGIEQINIEGGYVIVFCAGFGIAPSSQEYGFYYTEENIPVGIDCNLDIVCYVDNMQPEGSGYEGTVDFNTFYTEHIKGNIYFYSNAY